MAVDSRSASNQSTSTGPASLQQGVVIANYGAQIIVESDDHQRYRCSSRKNVGTLVAGDRVKLQTGQQQDHVITQRLPRDSELSRPDSRGKQKTIAANIDQILIVVAPRPELKEGLIDRYLVAAELSNITPVIVLNKLDLLDSDQQQQYEQRLSMYRQIGYQVIHTSAKKTHGLDELYKLMSGHTNIFVGQSGVGKSSLLNGLLPEAEARVGDVSEATNKGRHTTTTAWLYYLSEDHGNIIDSPGIREFGLWQINAEQVAYGFREFSDYRDQCKFRNCLHRQEPGCAVREAVAQGAIPQRRYESYLKLLESVEQNNQ